VTRAGVGSWVEFSKAAARAHASQLGIDLCGFAADGLIVLGTPIPLEVIGMRDLNHKQLAGGEVVQALESAAGQMARWLREQGADANALPAHDAARPELNTPAGQGRRQLRAAAVICGLGTWGLNMAVLTPRFGPRVFFAGIQTNLQFEPDPPLATELCLGLEACGRCAAVCPETAIPMRAPEGMALANARRVEARACMRSSQPGTPADGPAAYTGCIECLQVCPVGEDYDQVRQLPERQRDLPGGVRRLRAGGFVIVEHIGPVRRRT
jgi:epoxyqueuosine reductase